MTVIENLCPRCGAVPQSAQPQFYSDGIVPVPLDGSLYSCPSCGFLGIWETHYWREVTAAEREQLLHVSGVLTAQFIPIVQAMCQQSDIERLSAIICGKIDVPAEVIADLIDAIRDAGFHTHRDPIEVDTEGDQHDP